MPESLVRFLLRQRFIIRPGLESSDPVAAVNRYIEVLSQNGRTIQDKRVLVFGYGGRFAVGVELLRRGAAHVVLCDHVASLDEDRNRQLVQEYSSYIAVVDGRATPRPEFMTLLHGEIRQASLRNGVPPLDYILSTSVYEHLDDVDGITCALAQWTSSRGCHLHFVDLRDHFFRYPFEMLKFSERIWKLFLNPTSNLNRYRLNNYRKVFKAHFRHVQIEVMERDEASFLMAQPLIRPEFLTGDPSLDAATAISIFATEPVEK
jgi:hypothetical protein